MACCVTFNVSANCFWLWVRSLYNNSCNSISTNNFGFPERSQSFKTKSPLLNFQKHVSHVFRFKACSLHKFLSAKDDFEKYFYFDEMSEAMLAANALFQAQNSTFSLSYNTMMLLFWQNETCVVLCDSGIKWHICQIILFHTYG